MVSLLKGHRKVILVLAGAILIIFAVLWMMVLLPSMSKLPTDIDKSVTFEGTFQVANPQTMAMDTIPVTLTRSFEAIGTEGTNTLLIQEEVTVKNAVTGDDLTALFGSTGTLAVDRSNMEMVTDSPTANMPREGKWQSPAGVGDSFMIWNPIAHRALEATKTGMEEVNGLNVAVYKINVQQLALGPDPTANNFDAYVSTDATIKIEPTTGVIVDNSSLATISHDLTPMGLGIKPRVVMNLSYTDATVAEYIDIAKDNASKAFIYGTILPWGLVGIGAALVATPLLLIILQRSPKKSIAAKPVENPTPSSITIDSK